MATDPDYEPLEGSTPQHQHIVLSDLSDEELEQRCHDIACFMDEHDHEGFTAASLTTCFRVLVKAGLTTERELREIQIEEMISRQNQLAKSQVLQ